jgi:D-lactate dehydrogenase
MKISFFSTKSYEKEAFQKKLLASDQHSQDQFDFIELPLNERTVSLAQNSDAVCVFVSDSVNKAVLTQLKKNGVRLVCLRSAGFNHVDIQAAKDLGLPVVRVPEYSPHAVAEHALALILSLNRKTHRSYLRIKELNFQLDGLVGFDLYKKNLGVIGTGKIGACLCNIGRGLGMEVFAFDKSPSEELIRNGVHYVSLDELYATSDVISLHVPLQKETFHLIDEPAFLKMKTGVMLINTGRGALINAKSLIKNLKNKKIGSAGLDVYEEEEGVFFENLEAQGLQDDVLARLLTFPNVLITSHQAFLTHEALENIAETTLGNIQAFKKGMLENQVTK